MSARPPKLNHNSRTMMRAASARTAEAFGPRGYESSSPYAPTMMRAAPQPYYGSPRAYSDPYSPYGAAGPRTTSPYRPYYGDSRTSGYYDNINPFETDMGTYSQFGSSLAHNAGVGAMAGVLAGGGAMAYNAMMKNN
jgi:hypothetical protein